jgi:hypothetical protein
MYHAWQTSPGGSWSGWYSMGGQFVLAPYSPEVDSYSDGALWVRHVSIDGHRHFKYQIEPGGGWIADWLRA